MISRLLPALMQQRIFSTDFQMNWTILSLIEFVRHYRKWRRLAPNIVFTLGLRHTAVVCSCLLLMVESPVVQASFASVHGGVVNTFRRTALPRMATTNPYVPPTESTAHGKPSTRVRITTLVFAFYGVLTNAWYAMAVALYFFVFGDNSSVFGLYAIPPAVLLAGLSTYFLSRSLCNGRWLPSAIVCVATFPLMLFFTYNLFRFGI